MSRRTSITFRGEPDVEVEFEVEDDPETNGCCVLWNFADEHMRDVEATAEEDTAICEQLAAIEYDYCDDSAGLPGTP
jgi:hypothetical protein